jgi:chemotaxis response regulator CheB
MPSSQVQSPPPKSTLLEIPVVAIGASAGGLEAFTAILRALPTDIAMAFMLIQHLDPKCHSILPELLSNATRIPVLEAIDAMRIEVNRIYVMPSNVDISITDGPLRVETASHRPKAAFAHRHLMRSLAVRARARPSALFSRAPPRMVLRGADGNGWAGPIPLLLMASFGANS